MLILHGDNQILSRQQYLSLKSQATRSDKQLIELSGGDLTAADLVNVLGTSSLFGQTSAVFIENLFSRRPSHEKEDLIAHLKNNLSADIVIWETKDVTSQLKEIPAVNIRNFPFPKYIFEFLDTLSLSAFKKAVSVAPVEQVFASLVTRIHKNLLANPSPQNQSYINSLLTIDYAQKTSSPPYNLETALELWLLTL